MHILGILCGLLFILGGAIGVEEDTSYECLKSAVAKMSNSSCPLITPEVERNREEFARMYTACTKGHYLINNCNESEWAHACTRRVANIPRDSSPDSLRGIEDAAPMWKYCQSGISDPDYECFSNASDSFSNKTCPELSKESSKHYDKKTRIIAAKTCLKKLYVNRGCNNDHDHWMRACHKIIDALNVEVHGGQDNIDFYRNIICLEREKDPSYKCLESAIAGMNDNSCPEVLYAKAQNETAEEIGRHQISCFKRFYLTNKCEIADWKEVCKIHNFSFKTSEKRKLLRGYCNL